MSEPRFRTQEQRAAFDYGALAAQKLREAEQTLADARTAATVASELLRAAQASLNLRTKELEAASAELDYARLQLCRVHGFVPKGES